MYGIEVDRYQGRPPSVIGDVELSAAGNVVLRVGRVVAGRSWEQTEHVVLTPAEWAQLVHDLNEKQNDRDDEHTVRGALR